MAVIIVGAALPVGGTVLPTDGAVPPVDGTAPVEVVPMNESSAQQPSFFLPGTGRFCFLFALNTPSDCDSA